jgi:hypothetical protein
MLKKSMILGMAIAITLVITIAPTVNYKTAVAAAGDKVIGSGTGTITCTAGHPGDKFDAELTFEGEDLGGGASTGAATFVHAEGTHIKFIHDGSIDVNKKYEVGSNNDVNSTFCTGSGQGSFNISGKCGQNEKIKFVDDGSIGKFTGDVTCTS